jgi:hypothetical protein
MVSLPRMVNELPLDDHFTPHYGKLLIVFPLFQHELELPLRLPPSTKSLVRAIRARPSRAARYTLQDRHKRDVVGHTPTQPRPRESQRGQGIRRVCPDLRSHDVRARRCVILTLLAHSATVA